MGSFSITCCISDLTIGAGDEVRWFLLTENPYNSGVVNSHDLWFPRSIPLKAKYNDYGSIEEYDTKAPAIAAIRGCLDQDMIEQGVGDNTIHDVATRKGMEFDAILNAVGERRLKVSRQTWRTHLPSAEPERGIPTLGRVESLLEQEGIAKALVDERGHGWIRVREPAFRSTTLLEKALPILQKHFAAMLTSGTGCYSDFAEIQVMPKPALSDQGYAISHLKDEPQELPLLNQQAMILEPVWQALCHRSGYQSIRSQVQEAWDFCLKSSGNNLESSLRRYLADKENQVFTQELDQIAAEELDSLLFFRDPIPFTTGPFSHLAAAAKSHVVNPFDSDQIEDLLDNLTGLLVISQEIFAFRYYWRPSYICGSQFGNHLSERDWNATKASIADQFLRQSREELCDCDREEQPHLGDGCPVW